MLSSVSSEGASAAGLPADEVMESAKCWSNSFTGRVLTPIAEKLWAIERPFTLAGMDIGGRSAVVLLQDGSLWVHSPMELTDQLRSKLKAIGPVKHIVAANNMHTTFVPQWKEAFPQATLWGAPGLPQLKPDKKFDREVGVNNAIPSEWHEDLEATHLDYETTPIAGKPLFNEVVFWHKPSRTLLVTDVFWSYPKDVPTATRLAKEAKDKLLAPFYNNFMKGDQGKYQAAIERVFAWDWDGILPCHGVYLAQGGQAALRQHLHEPDTVSQHDSKATGSGSQ